MSEEFVTDEQMVRAKEVVRKLLYRKTMDDVKGIDEIEKFGCLYDYNIFFEGWDCVVIEIERFSMDIEEIQELTKIEEIDSISLINGRLRIYIEKR